MNATASPSTTLSTREQAIVPVAAFGATGDVAQLDLALHAGLDDGLTLSEAKEVLVQLYAYAGFPRSLNALGVLMRVVDDRRQRGIHDAPGSEPGGPIPQGEALLAAGTANQTTLVGSPVTGALFAFAPAADRFLKTHLFGDIFARDNLDWRSREIATIAMLSALVGVDAQLESHMAIALNIGITGDQLAKLIDVLATRVDVDAAKRAEAALAKRLAPDGR